MGSGARYVSLCVGPRVEGSAFKSLLHVTDIFPILYVNAVLSISQYRKWLKMERRSRVSGSVNRVCVLLQMVLGPTDRARAWVASLRLLVERIWKAFPFALPGQ